MLTRVAFACLLALTGPGWADCPPAPDISARMDALLAEVQQVGSEQAARGVSARMWEEWVKAPDLRAQELLDEGMQRRQAFDLTGAVIAFDALIAYCPRYAEGYNQRAFANFIREDYEAALVDLDRAIELRPRHVAAIAGRGLTLIALDRVADGQAAIRAAMALNPWLSERRFLDLAVDPEDRAIDL
ncbi:hypothetical protein [Jannaschia sp. M317]|uniref:tetratricopeptide repeat protein n=1 Tax=Jannaschia sp. M317 TaxID=2867011 RepID=UPI0021A6AEF2|nr:hypothetical protein [Jannaschia sp. M317]UWQ17888.1 hypothetical protein K3551_00785 [Jannaschia sp. M317]